IDIDHIMSRNIITGLAGSQIRKSDDVLTRIKGGKPVDKPALFIFYTDAELHVKNRFSMILVGRVKHLFVAIQQLIIKLGNLLQRSNSLPKRLSGHMHLSQKGQGSAF